MFRRWLAISVWLCVLAGCGDEQPNPPSAGAGSAGMLTAAVGGGGSGGVAGAAGGGAGCSSVPLTYSGFAAPFFADNCNRCHGAGVKAPNGLQPPATATFSTESDVIRLRDKIRKAAIVDKWMPPDARLSDCVVEQLSKYLDTLPTP